MWRDAVVMVTLAALGFGVVSGAEAAVEPGEAASGVDVACTRALVDVIYGFLLTLLALTIALWGSFKPLSEGMSDMLKGLIVGVFAPLLDLGVNVEGSCRCVPMLWKYHNFPNLDESSRDMVKQTSKISPIKRLSSSLSPFSKSPVRILATCKIIIYTLKESELHQNRMIRFDEEDVIDECEAMVIGEVGDGKTKEHVYIRKQLSFAGTLVLVLADVFPQYDEFKFLRGTSGFAMVAIAVQAVGYIHAVVYRSAMDLKVAPIEVVGLTFNIYLLIKASLFSTCNPCHRPLVIFMNKKKNQQLNNFISKIDEKQFVLPYIKIKIYITFCAVIVS